MKVDLLNYSTGPNWLTPAGGNKKTADKAEGPQFDAIRAKYEAKRMAKRRQQAAARRSS